MTNNFPIFQLIQAGVLQGCVLASALYNIFTSDILHATNTILATFAEDIDNDLTLTSKIWKK